MYIFGSVEPQAQFIIKMRPVFLSRIQNSCCSLDLDRFRYLEPNLKVDAVVVGAGQALEHAPAPHHAEKIRRRRSHVDETTETPAATDRVEGRGGLP